MDEPARSGASGAAPALAAFPDPGRILDPIDRLSEVTFGLFMALTFTCTMSVATGDGTTVNAVLAAALGCNIAWGLVDGAMHVLTSVAERGRALSRARAIRAAGPAEARALVRRLLPGELAASVPDAEADAMVALMRHVAQGEGRARATAEDLRGALAIFLIVVLATFPPVVPFLLIDTVTAAVRVSNLIAVLMLAGIGWKLDRLMGRDGPPMRWVMPLAGTALVAVTIALGG